MARNKHGTKIWSALVKSFQMLTASAQNEIRSSGLCLSDFAVLDLLMQRGPLPVNTMGPLVGLTPGSISIAVDRLVRRRLVTRRATADDRRVRMVTLTAAGRALISEARAHHTAAMEKAASVLSADECAQLVALLDRLCSARRD